MEVNGVTLNTIKKIFHLIFLGSVNSLHQLFRISIALGEHVLVTKSTRRSYAPVV